jgi:hypothetical protein
MAHSMICRPFFASVSLALGLVALVPACNIPLGNGDSTSGASGGTAPTTDPPVITSLNMSASASATNDSYTVFGSISYSDDDDVVVSAQVHVYVTGQTLNIPVDDQESNAYGVPFSFNLSADPPLGGAGPTDYTVTLTNKGGAVSAGIEETVDLL